MKVINYKAFILLGAILLAQGCATHSSLYYWGDYEDIIYDIYLNPGEADPVTQIDKLNRTIEQAENRGKQVPPGLYAHLGLVHAQVGNPGLAKSALLQEKSLYPEAGTFIDGILKRSNMANDALEASNTHHQENAQ